ncbi:MAG: type IV pilus secretin PilQ, partial [Deltaproteobacteria bacterium]
AAIPEELKMTLDASELNTVVSSVSSFKPSALGGEADNSVRVLVKLNEKAAYTVKESNGTINVAFAASRAVKAVPTVTGTPAPVIEIPVVKPLEDASMQPRKYKGPNIDIDMIDAQITDILKLLAEVSDKNIVASEEVRGTITLRLKNIPWEQTFDLILQAKGLDSVEEGNVIRVAPRERLRKEKEELLAAKKAEEKQEDLQTEYIRINYDKASTLAPQIKSVLSDRGVPTVHEATNTLIIRDTKAGIAAAKDYIKQVDKPTPQVLIEARIVEAETSFARDLGIQWGVDTRVPGSTHTSKVHTAMFGSSDQLGSAAPYPDIQAATIAATPVFGQTKTGFSGDAGVSNYAVNLPATGTAGTLGALGFILGKTGANPMILDLRISAGEQQGHVKTISRPRIITMNNKEAKIEQGESIPFETSSASGTATSFIDANLSLTVTPQITPDGSVLMSIKASRNSIGTFRTSAGKPSINKKEATTNVLVKNGETTVIGGIIVSDSSTSERGIPLLKDIPVLGWLFKAKSISDSQKELLIFITPTIVEEKTAG